MIKEKIKITRFTPTLVFFGNACNKANWGNNRIAYAVNAKNRIKKEWEIINN